MSFGKRLRADPSGVNFKALFVAIVPLLSGKEQKNRGTL